MFSFSVGAGGCLELECGQDNLECIWAITPPTNSNLNSSYNPPPPFSGDSHLPSFKRHPWICSCIFQRFALPVEGGGVLKIPWFGAHRIVGSTMHVVDGDSKKIRGTDSEPRMPPPVHVLA